jgi:hypothetical protein
MAYLRLAELFPFLFPFLVRSLFQIRLIRVNPRLITSGQLSSQAAKVSLCSLLPNVASASR